ncbi:MAG: helix-turn-helix transcriptional regulator [Thermodesulfobacteriota bacterium]
MRDDHIPLAFVAVKNRLKEAGLSHREQEVAYLICKGLKNSEVADKLCISTYTVENHLRSIFAKFGVNRRTSLIPKMIGFD